MVVDFQPVQLLKLLLGLFVKLLLYLQLRGLFGCAGGRVALLFSYGLALAPVCAGPIEFLEEGAEVFNAGQFVEAKELLLFDLFVAEGVLADGSFEEVEGVEKVDLRSLVVDAELVVVLQAIFEVVELVDLLDYLLLLLLEYPLQVLLVLLLLLLYQFLQLLELLANQLLVDLIGLLDPAFVPFADRQIFVDFFDPALGVCFELEVVPVDGGEGVPHRADVVVFLFLHVFVHALHAHDDGFLLAVEHQGLLVGVALHLARLLALPALVVACPARGIVTGLAVALVDVRSLPLSVDVVPALSVRHLPQLALAQLPLALRIVRLLELVLAELGTLHVHEQQLLLLLPHQILDAQRCRVFSASRTAQPELGVEGRNSFGNFDPLGTLEAELVLAVELYEGARLLLAIQTH